VVQLMAKTASTWALATDVLDCAWASGLVLGWKPEHLGARLLQWVWTVLSWVLAQPWAAQEGWMMTSEQQQGLLVTPAQKAVQPGAP
jgi:hypothetical protein